MSALPENAILHRDLGELDQFSVPAGLLKEHSLKEGVWGRLEVISGSINFVWTDPESKPRVLTKGAVNIIPPVELHHLELLGPVRMKLALYKASDQS